LGFDCIKIELSVQLFASSELLEVFSCPMTGGLIPTLL